MPKIKVTKPFSLRLASGEPLREFLPGEHSISREEHDHWFMQGCLDPKDGRAVLLADTDEDDAEGDELVAPTREELMKLTNDSLAALLKACGAEPIPGMKKADMVDALLVGQEGVTLMRGPDGIHVQKAEA